MAAGRDDVGAAADDVRATPTPGGPRLLRHDLEGAGDGQVAAAAAARHGERGGGRWWSIPNGTRVPRRHARVEGGEQDGAPPPREAVTIPVPPTVRDPHDRTDACAVPNRPAAAADEARAARSTKRRMPSNGATPAPRHGPRPQPCGKGVRHRPGGAVSRYRHGASGTSGDPASQAVFGPPAGATKHRARPRGRTSSTRSSPPAAFAREVSGSRHSPETAADCQARGERGSCSISRRTD